MIDNEELLAKLKSVLTERNYRIRIHAVRHMVEEGFTERNIIAAIEGKSRILENYSEESRCLIVGYFRLSDKVRCPLHIVCDYSDAKCSTSSRPTFLRSLGGARLRSGDKLNEQTNESGMF